MSNLSALTCPQCRSVLPWSVINAAEMTGCPTCATDLEVTIFPALLKGLEQGQKGELLVEEGTAGCFYHPQKKAVIACQSCGRFLCALCDITLADQHICAACIETGKRKGRIEQISTHRVLYDEVAISLCLLPLLIWPLTIFTAPAAVYVAVRHWDAPTSIIPRTKSRMVTAVILGALEICAWVFLAAYLWMGS